MKNQEADITVVKEKKSPHGLIQLRSDNILVFRPDITTFKEYDMEILKDLHVDLIEISEGIPRPYMSDNRHITGIIGKEEKEYINEGAHEFATHIAILTYSSVMKVLLNAYNAVFKPKVKIKLFKTEKDAVKWLLDSQ